MVSPQPSFATLRLVNHLAAPCILDATLASRLGRDFLDALIVLAVVQANVTPLSRDPELQRAYAGYDEPPPDELRRPVSINAVAHSLRLPYETVRRRIARLARLGVCEVSVQGVVVPARELASPEHMAAMLVVWEQVRKLYCRLRDLGVLDEALQAVGPAPDGPPPLRAVARVASDYMLRVVEHVSRELPGLVGGVVWLTVLRANAEPAPGAEAGEAVEDLTADLRRRPVRVAEIARRLDAPQETIRRYAAELTAQGLLKRTQKGLVAPAEILARPKAVQLMRENFADLMRMFSGLAQFGVLAEWDRQFPPLRGAA
jgi:DNA-binding Lrp family transcriptional regulator